MIYLLPHAVLQSADRFPGQEAFRCGNRSLTYAELAQKIGQLSRLLIESGLHKGSRVGVYLNRSLETAVAIYGIMHAGGVYVPLDPHAPPARTRFLIKDCDIALLVTNPSQKRPLHKVMSEKTGVETIIGLKADWPVETISWEEAWQLPLSAKGSPRVLENDPAYIMYTSGSTGSPKGIVHTHYSGLSYAKLSAGLYHLNHNDRIGNHAPIHFDISTLGYFTAPLVGATTVIVSDAHTKMPTSLSLLIEEEEMTVWYSVPLALIQMLQNGILEKRNWQALRWILYGGEPFPVKYLRQLMGHLPHTRFSNVYGPAEVNQCTYYHLPDLPEEGEDIPIGQVWENTDLLIMDDKGQPVPDGTTGELFIRSATMMRAYWNQPELTQNALFRSVTASGLEETFYRTGDLVQLNPDGQLLFQGRKDRQIKIRGYRVELDEVEAVLTQHPSVGEAAVFTVEKKEEGERQAVAAVALISGETPTEEELVHYLKTQLPWYAVPHKISILASLPRTATDKVNRRLLQEKFINLL